MPFEKQQLYAEQHGLNKAIDLSHHLSDLSKARTLSPLKGLQKHTRPDAIQFGGGLPSAAYFPFTSLSADTLISKSFPLSVPSSSVSPSKALTPTPANWFWRLFGSSTEQTEKIAIPKTPSANDEGLNLSVALQYGPATGLAPLRDFLQHFSGTVYKPAYSDFTTLVHTGNTDGWTRVVFTLLNPGVGDKILAEEWAFATALSTARPLGVDVIPVGMDGEGMSAVALREILDGWDVVRDGKKPRLIYTVPVGQNPSGATMGLQRKKEIYDICVQHDIIICEDDPYYFLQFGEYVHKPLRSHQADDDEDDAHYFARLVPSFLRVDTQGRVIRLDTFSKTIAPGVRLGWFTCNPLFAERLERHGETSTQAPCGLGQSLVTKLLLTWKYDGYVRWLRGLRIQYGLRRDLFIDILSEEFDLHTSVGSASMGAWSGQTVYTAYAKPKSTSLFGSAMGMMSEKRPLIETRSQSRRLLSFVAPSSGMFVWLKLYFDDLPIAPRSDPESHEIKLWTKLADAGVLTSPGWFFAADQEEPPTDPNLEGHMRMSFSTADEESMRKGLKIFAKVVREVHGL